METAWIQVFVLTMSQCIAPAGKMVCQEELVEYHFANEADCDRVLTQMVDLASRADNILINHDKSSCQSAMLQSSVYASADAAKASLPDAQELAVTDRNKASPDFQEASHVERLQSLQACEDTRGVPPCRVGEIIIEAQADAKKTEVWRRQN